MNRVKTFDATGVAPDGRLYAGDLNMIQDAAAALADLTQNLQVGSVAVGEAGLQISRYGAGEIQLSGALRTTGILRGLGGLFGGTFTTAQRDAIAAGSRPYGLVITNTTNNRLEWNSGTDAAPNWQPVGPTGPWATADIADGAITSAKIADGTIVNADVAAGAAIAYSKLALGGSILNADIAGAAAIAQTKIASVLGLASLSADVNYLKGNSGAIILNNLIQLPNGYGLASKNTGGTVVSVAYVDAANNLLVGYDTNIGGQIVVGRGQVVNFDHSTGNAMMALNPSYGGAGLPGMTFYNSAGGVLVIFYSDGTYFRLGGTVYLRQSDGVMLVGGAAMRVHRHPYATDRHIESGTYSSAGSGSTSVTFVDPFASAPNVALSANVSPASGGPYITGKSTTGVSIYTPGTAWQVDWIAEGTD